MSLTEGTVLDDGALRRARALAVPTRAALLEALRAASGPMTAAELAAVLSVHHTAVRQHVAVLLDVGLVAAERMPQQGRGRPRQGYRAAGDVDPYLRLSVLLAEVIRDGATPREVGRRHGTSLEPSGPVIEALRVEGERMGFRPRVESGEDGLFNIVLDACPFAAVAAHDAETVCSLHLGIAEGIVQALGGARVEKMQLRNPREAGCRLVVSVGDPAP